VRNLDIEYLCVERNGRASSWWLGLEALAKPDSSDCLAAAQDSAGNQGEGDNTNNQLADCQGQFIQGVHTWLILTKAYRALLAFADRSIECLDICPTDFSVLELLLHKGPLPVNTIGKKVFLASGSITAAIDRLASLRLVARHDDPGDRRVRVVVLTEQGETLIREKFAEHKEHMSLAFSALGKDEIVLLQNLLRKLGKGAEEILATSRRLPNQD